MASVGVTIDFASHYGEWSEFRKQEAVREKLLSMGHAIATQATANAVARGAHHRDPTDDATYWVNDLDLGSRVGVYVGASSAEAKVAENLHGALRDALWAGAGE